MGTMLTANPSGTRARRSDSIAPASSLARFRVGIRTSSVNIYCRGKPLLPVCTMRRETGHCKRNTRPYGVPLAEKDREAKGDGKKLPELDNLD